MEEASASLGNSQNYDEENPTKTTDKPKKKPKRGSKGPSDDGEKSSRRGPTLREPKYKCELCSFSTAYLYSINRHAVKAHKDTLTQPDGSIKPCFEKLETKKEPVALPSLFSSPTTTATTTAASVNGSSIVKTPSEVAGPSKRRNSPSVSQQVADGANESSAVDVALADVTDQPPPSEMDVMDKLKNVQDISVWLKDQQSGQADSQSSPAMISEGAGGKFQTVNLFWLDIYSPYQTPGTLLIFGKVKSPPPGNGFSSCCLVVKNLERRVFLMPREKEDGTLANYMDLYNEFYSVICPKYKITSFGAKRSTKKYCFDIQGIHPVAEYMEVRYPGTLPELPQDLNGETFSHAFGTNTDLDETFLLEKKLKGPCWLQIFYCQQVLPDQQQSWCKFEFTCDASSVNIHPLNSTLPTPPLVLASLNIQAVHDDSSNEESIVFAGVAVNQNYNLKSPNDIFQDFFCLLNKPTAQIWPLDIDLVVNERTLKMDSEQSMLECLLSKLVELDPDVYVCSHRNFQLLLRQILHFKVPKWSRVGRLKRSMPAIRFGKQLSLPFALSGRLLCNVEIAAKVLLRAPSYDLGSLCSEFLDLNDNAVVTLTGAEMKVLFTSTESLHSFVKWGMQQCVLSIRLVNELQVMPLAVEISHLLGATISRTLMGPLRLNQYFLHFFTSKDYIVPDWINWSAVEESDDHQAGNEYGNAIELTSKQRFYDDYVILLYFDWHSVLKSAMEQEFNKANCDGAKVEPIKMMDDEIRRLEESLKQVQSLMKATNVMEDTMRQYDIRIKALKWTIASMYSCHENRYWRFHSKKRQQYIKAKVWDLLREMKEHVRKMGFQVIHVDVDDLSVMIATHTQTYSAALKIKTKIIQELVSIYPFLEVDDVTIYRYALLLKNSVYFALESFPPSKSKDWFESLAYSNAPAVAPIATDTVYFCFREIFSEQPLNDKFNNVDKILRDLSAKLRNGTVSLERLMITETLDKDPELYEDADGLDHITVALRMNESDKLIEDFTKGDQVSYFFCTDGKPHHESEMNEEGLKVDVDYYLAKMLYPIVSEICESIPGLGFNHARVADALGVPIV